MPEVNTMLKIIFWLLKRRGYSISGLVNGKGYYIEKKNVERNSRERRID